MVSRLEQLIEAIERGESITAATVEQCRALIALDAAVAADRFADDFLARQAEADAALDQLV